MNPFESRFIRPDCNQYRFCVDPQAHAEQFDAFLATLQHRFDTDRCAAIVGPHGTGKSTLIHTMLPLLQTAFDRVILHTLRSDQPYSFSRLRQHADAEAGEPHKRVCWLVDGYEQLSLACRLRVRLWLKTRSNWRLLVSSHRHLWTIPTVVQTRFDERLAQVLINEKIVSVPTTLRDKLMSAFQERLDRTSAPNRNLRELWFDMYDIYEKTRL